MGGEKNLFIRGWTETPEGSQRIEMKVDSRSGTVLTVGPVAKTGTPVEGKVLEYDESFRLLPGDVNAHSHPEQSLYVDFVDPAYAPGTGTIEVGGVTSFEALYLLRQTKDLDYVACDVVEVLPAFDPTQITAYLAGCVAHEFIAMMAYRKRKAESGHSS